MWQTTTFVAMASATLLKHAMTGMHKVGMAAHQLAMWKNNMNVLVQIHNKGLIFANEFT